MSCPGHNYTSSRTIISEISVISVVIRRTGYSRVDIYLDIELYSSEILITESPILSSYCKKNQTILIFQVYFWKCSSFHVPWWKAIPGISWDTFSVINSSSPGGKCDYFWRTIDEIWVLHWRQLSPFLLCLSVYRQHRLRRLAPRNTKNAHMTSKVDGCQSNVLNILS